MHPKPLVPIRRINRESTDLPSGAADADPIPLIGRQLVPSIDNDPQALTNELFTYLYAKPPIQNLCCKLKFVDHVSWRKHQSARHVEQSPSYLCTRCNKHTFEKINGVSSHYSKCNPSETVQPPSFANPDNPTEPNNEESFPCKWCNLSYTMKTGLGVHAHRVVCMHTGCTRLSWKGKNPTFA